MTYGGTVASASSPQLSIQNGGENPPDFGARPAPGNLDRRRPERARSPSRWGCAARNPDLPCQSTNPERVAAEAHPISRVAHRLAATLSGLRISVCDPTQGSSQARNPGLNDAIPLGLAEMRPGLVGNTKLSVLILFTTAELWPLAKGWGRSQVSFLALSHRREAHLSSRETHQGGRELDRGARGFLTRARGSN